MNKRMILSLLVLVFLLSACAGSNMPEAMVAYDADSYGGGFEDRAVAEMEAPGEPAESGSFSNATGTVVVQRMVIKNASLSIIVAEPALVMDDIMAMAESMGGFVVTSNMWQTTLGSGMTVDQATITIRVPAERLDEALDHIKAGAGEVRSENISGEDVTSQYTDLQSRLRNLETAEAQLTQIMEDATDTEDVLQVYNRLVEVGEEIEVIKGQMQYYEQASALSSISIDIIADEADQPIQIGGWEPVGVAKDAVEALINFLQGFVDFVIWLLIFILPVLVVIGFPLVLLWRGFRNWRHRRKAKKQAEKSAE